ncbi:MAG: CoA pyrophosphatase [Anaerolineaceae bacterium]|nr:CoA pyrophosphatase [Anaerolineaceae bacterium]
MVDYLTDENITEEDIRNFLTTRPDRGMTLPGSAPYRTAAVLIPLLVMDGEWHVLYTRRTEIVQDHKGQVSFPGGATEEIDQSAADTALREAQEEIGLKPEQVRILGFMSQYPSITDFLVTPVAGKITWPFEMSLSKNEVGRVFTIPIKWLADPRNREEKLMTRPSGQVWVSYYKPYDGEILWGLTARITVNFLEILGLIRTE